jgi:putative transposase
MGVEISRRLSLTRRQRKILEEFAGSRKEAQGLAFRVRVILLWGEGLSIKETSRTLGLARDTVRSWRRRWLGGVQAWGGQQKQWLHSVLRDKIREQLSDQPRPGAPVKFEAEEVCQIIALACKSPTHLGIPVSHWSARDLREAVLKEEIVSSISTRTVGRILKKATSSPIGCATT